MEVSTANPAELHHLDPQIIMQASCASNPAETVCAKYDICHDQYHPDVPVPAESCTVSVFSYGAIHVAISYHPRQRRGNLVIVC